MRQLALSLLLLALSATPPSAQQKPKVPPGIDPGGVRIALIGTGIDYTDAALSQRLARDGEGTLVSADFLVSDFLAFEPEAEKPATLIAKRILAARKDATFVAVRVNSRAPVDPRDASRHLLPPLLFPPVATARLIIITSTAMAPLCRAGQTAQQAATQIDTFQSSERVRRASPSQPIVIVAPCPAAPGRKLSAAVVSAGFHLLEIDPKDGAVDGALGREDSLVVRIALAALASHAENPKWSALDVRRALEAGFRLDPSK
jgi:hypothetical protein